MSFSVIRSAQTLVGPCEPTPSDILHLSSIDRVPGLRHMVRSLHVFKQGQEPAKVMREAVAKVLVPYYPFAGRIVDSDDGEVQVACNAEGALFVEASANCSLEDVKYLEHPLVISEKDLLPDPTPEAEINPLNLPFMMQVTEFTCGGFVVGLACVHTLSDGLGAAQFLTAIGELARGRSRPTVEPIWSRELIPNPPKPQLSTGPPILPSFKFQHANIDITPDRIAQIKAQFLDRNGQHCSAFDVTMAKAWQSRTRAINLDDPDTDVQLCFFASTRHLLTKVLPPQGGYYGNCFYPVTVTAASGKVAGAELIEVVRLIREGKARLPVEFAKWAAGDFNKDPYELTFSYNSLFVSDWTKLGFFEVDYGWGTPVHIVPFTYTDFMAVAILGAPPAPMKGVRLMTQCVEKEHFAAFQDQMSNFS